jgi:16S rRNA processing protein RimM
MTTDNSVQQAQQWVWLARIRRAQGRKGEVFADILTDFPEKFAERKHLWLVAEPGTPAGKTHPTPVEVNLANHWLHKGGIVLHFAQSDSISSAEALAGLYVAIPLDQRAALDADTVYVGDLIGCVVVDVASQDGSEGEQTGATAVDVGVIEDVDREAGPTPMLVVRGAKGEVLIPFAKSYLRKIDLAARRVEMALPQGLVEINEPGKG